MLLPDPDARAAMYSLEATVQELVFIVGPALAGAVAALASPSAAVLAAGVVAVAGVVSFALTPGLDRVAGGRREPLRPARLRPLLPLFLAGFLLICGLSWVEVGVIGAAGSAGADRGGRRAARGLERRLAGRRPGRRRRGRPGADRPGGCSCCSPASRPRTPCSPRRPGCCRSAGCWCWPAGWWRRRWAGSTRWSSSRRRPAR